METTFMRRDKVAKLVLVITGIVLAVFVVFVPLLSGLGGNHDLKDASASLPKPSSTASATPTPTALPTTGVEETDGTNRQLPLYLGTDEPVVFDSTTDPMTPALLDGSLKYQNQTHSWADLVKRVGNQSGYIDGVNARAGFTGFNWSDVLKFAAVDKTDTDVEARIIQVFNLPDISNADVREQVRPYMGDLADTLQIMHINSKFVNTINVGTKQNLKMGDYVDGQKMIRVSLMPIIFDANGTPIQLDASKGAGIFIDCGNLHWVPKKVFECTDSSCTPPPPVTPPVETPPTTTPPTLVAKIPSQGSGPRGNAPIGSGVNEDRGPGTYVPPAAMEQPPAAPYVPPAAPTPVVPAPTAPTPNNPSPAPVPTPDPAPAPSPEPSAPTPSTAPSTCPIPPGQTSC